MPDRKTPSSSKYMFRFTQDEVEEMENLLKENNNANPSARVFHALAVKFSKTRHQQGLSYVRHDSVQNWFRKRRHMIRQAAKALSFMKSTKPSDPSSAAEIERLPENEMKSDGEDASSKRSSEEESSEGVNLGGVSGRIVPASSISNSAGIVDHMDELPQPLPLLLSQVSDADSVIARLAKFKRPNPEAIPKASLNLHIDAAGVDARDLVFQAKLTLERVARMNLVDFRSHERDFDLAVSIIIEKGFLSDSEKTDLLLLQEQIVKTVKDNEHAREELSKCNSFREKLTEAAESASKIMKKANHLEEKYNKIPQEMSAVSSKISQLEAALVQAKAELEIMKGDQEDVANKLAELCKSLESVNKHYKSLKAEETSMIEKRARIEENLVKNTEEWVRLTHRTHSTGFTENKGGP